MLLAMVVRAGRTPGARRRFDPLLLVTAVLGLVWNLCALPVYELPKVGIEGPFPVLAAIGFGALGFLPAVVVHSVLRGERDARARRRQARRWRRSRTPSARSRPLLHAAGAGVGRRPVPSALGMRLLTYTFVALVVPLAAVTRGQPGARRALWAAALAIFAVSALHLSQLHQGDASWPVELRRPSRVAAAGVRDPLPGLSVRAGRSVPEARAGAARAGRASRSPRVATLRRAIRGVRAVRRSAIRGRSASWSRSGSATALLYPALRRGHRLVRRRDRAPSAGLPVAARDDRAPRCRRTTTSPALLPTVCELLAPGAERARRDLARVAMRRRRGIGRRRRAAARRRSIDRAVGDSRVDAIAAVVSCRRAKRRATCSRSAS